jgi:hypothetical protein
MKPRHAAALALVGWYLMVPTSWNDRLSQWQVEASFDTAAECMKARLKIQLNIKTFHPNQDPSITNRIREMLQQAQCIASDDPRLKEK